MDTLPEDQQVETLPFGMANCNTCAKPISQRARKCPHCGDPRPIKSTFKTVATIVYIIMCILCLLSFFIGVLLEGHLRNKEFIIFGGFFIMMISLMYIALVKK